MLTEKWQILGTATKSADKLQTCMKRFAPSDPVILLISAMAALASGLLVNNFRSQPLALVYQSKAERMQDAVEFIHRIQAEQAPTATLKPQQGLPESLSLEEFSRYVESKRGLILDARPQLFYRVGHVPGALSLPREDFERGYAALRGKLESCPSLPIVIYCSDSSCEDSKLVRNSLRSLGCSNLGLFEPGWATWSAAGKKVEVSR
jgi:rhodanese-related sulfurtransferase